MTEYDLDRGQMAFKNGNLIVNTPESIHQPMIGLCPNCEFGCRRAIHPRTSERMCPHCLESVGPALLAA